MSDEDKNVWRGPHMTPPETEPVTLRTADDRRDELLAIAATLMSGWCNDGTLSVSDRFVMDAVNLADRLIRAVDKFTGTRAKTEGDK